MNSGTEADVETLFVSRKTAGTSREQLVLDFSACYKRELPSVTWFVMSLGADASRAADVAQSTFAEAFAIWDRIEHPTAWLRRVARRIYYRHLDSHETPVDAVPEQYSPLSAADKVELQDEANAVLAALADLPPKQRQVMAWSIDGFSPTEVARELNIDSATVRQNLAKARKSLKRQLGISGGGNGGPGEL
jgi:RNA polymerase sigma factor (sigma-70 family)